MWSLPMPASARRLESASGKRPAGSSSRSPIRLRPSSMPQGDRRGRRGAPRFDLALDPHRRHNPLIDEWVLVSPSRTERPWLGATETEGPGERPAYDPRCYLCPGNTRANGDVNPRYDATFVFTNDFSALRPDTG